jgi:sugar/nucleoside kinase (ribokinase family)
MCIRVDVFGEVALDHILYINNSQKSSYKWTIDEFKNIVGGTGANIAVAYNLIGCDVEFFTGISAENDYCELYNRLSQSGITIIDIASGKISEFYNLIFSDEMRRTVAVYPGEILKRTSIPFDLVGQADILHVTPIAISAAREIPQYYKDAIKILSPAGEFLGIDKGNFKNLIKSYDILCLDAGEAFQYLDLKSIDAALNWFEKIDSLCTVITLGKQGAICLCENQIFSIGVPQFTLPVIDPMGCGDIFAASFAYYFLKTIREFHKH